MWLETTAFILQGSTQLARFTMKTTTILALLLPALAGRVSSSKEVGASRESIKANKKLGVRPHYDTHYSGVQCCKDIYAQTPKTPGNACIYVAPWWAAMGWFKGPGSVCSLQCKMKFGADWQWGVEK